MLHLRHFTLKILAMAPKRVHNSTPSGVGKKRKVHSSLESPKQTQGTLDNFIGRSPQRSEASPSKRKPSKNFASTSRHTLDVIESDEVVALRLAASDGVDVKTTQEMEQVWKSHTSGSTSSQQLHEVIDVDSFSEEVEAKVNRTTKSMDSSTPKEASTRGHPRAPLSAVATKATASQTFLPRPRADHIDISSYPNLAVDPLEFSCLEPPWGDGKSTPYSFLTHTFCSLSATRSRIDISNILTNALRSIIRHDQRSLLHALYLLSNSLAPPYVPIELGLGPSIISKAIQRVSGLTPAAINRLYTKFGDPGDVAFEAKSNVRTLVPHPPLTVNGVFASLLLICNTKGSGAGKQKASIVEKLLVAAKGEEARFLVRTMGQHIRVGAVRTSILTALARALVLTQPPTLSDLTSSTYFAGEDLIQQIKPTTGRGKQKVSNDSARADILQKYADAEALLKRVYVQHPNYDHIIEAILDAGLKGLADRVILSIGNYISKFEKARSV